LSAGLLPILYALENFRWGYNTGYPGANIWGHLIDGIWEWVKWGSHTKFQGDSFSGSGGVQPDTHPLIFMYKINYRLTVVLKEEIMKQIRFLYVSSIIFICIHRWILNLVNIFIDVNHTADGLIWTVPTIFRHITPIMDIAKYMSFHYL
jgi:hypothetical protein